MATPLIAPLKVQGGTFYSLISPTKDITSQFGDDAKVVLSNFVCLDLPNINLTPTNDENYMQLRGIQSAINSGIDGVTDLNVALAQHFQNYILNLEQLTLDNENYLKTRKSTGERIFFKWLKEIGAIRFRLANNTEKNDSVVTDRFVEEDESLSYKKVVKYVGDISVNNIVEKGGVSYQETYMLIPTNSGSTPDVLFKSEADSNYNIGDQFQGQTEFIEGQTASSGHPEGLSLSAYYDDDITNTYNTSSPIFNDATNSTKTINTGNGNLEFLSSNLDGIGIEFDSFSYQKIATDVDIQSISEFNSTKLSSDFGFNAVLIYYRVFDRGNIVDFQTNLFGVFFLDQIKQTPADGGFIERIKKFKFDGNSNQLGNSWGLKLNMQITSNDNDVTVESIINEYNTFSMSIFTEVSVNVQNLLDISQEYQRRVAAIELKIESLELLNFAETTSYANKTDLELLREEVENANLIFSNSESILELISQLSDKINNIINGKTDANVILGFDGLRSGPGIKLSKSNSSVTIESNATSYNTPSNTEFSELTYLTTHSLNSLNNYHKLSGNDNFKLLEDYDFIIDNRNVSWVKGQLLRLSLGFKLDYGIFNIYIKTYDPKGEDLITIFSSNSGNSSKIIDIICIDQNISNFVIDTI